MALLRHLQLLRANTADLTSHIGYPGELIVNTDTWELTLHDGVTPGGYTASANLVVINAEIAALQANLANVSSNSLINGSNVVSLDANGGLNLANVGLIRGPDDGNVGINLASDYFVQMQWSANANTADPNSDWTGSTTWVYVDNGGFHVEAITPDHDAYWNFDTAGNLTFPDSTIQTTAFSNIALANYLAGNVTIGNLTVQGNITTVNTEVVQHNEIVAGNITSNSYVTAQQFVGNLSYLTNGTYTARLNQYGAVSIPNEIDFVGYLGNARIYSAMGFNFWAQPADNIYLNTITGVGGTQWSWKFDTTGNLTLAGNLIIPAGANIKFNDGSHLNSASITQLTNGSYAASLNQYGALNVPNEIDFVGYLGNARIYSSMGFNLHSAPTDSIVLQTQNGSSQQFAWQFDQYGNITFPDYTVQHTAFSNAAVQTYLTANPVTVSSLTNGSYTFALQSQGYLTVPTSTYGTAQMFSSAGVPLFIGTLDSGNYWQLKTGGILQFPDNTQQTTAFSNTAPIIQVLSANSYQQQAQIGNLQASAYSNVNVIAYLAGNITVGNISAHYFTGNGSQLTGLPAGYSNVQVATYLPTYTGNVGAGNITANYVYATNYVSTGAVYSPTIGNTGAYITGANVNIAGNVNATYFVGNGYFLTGIVASSGGTNYSNVNVAAYLNTQGYNLYSNVNVAAYLAGTSYTNYSNVNVAAYSQTQGYTNYSNVNVAAYIATFGSGGGGSYGNANVAAYMPTYLPSYNGNVGVNSILGTSPNVTLVSNSYSTTYDITGNVAFGNTAYPVQITAFGNISTGGYLFGNGAFLTGIVASSGGSNYSNANVAAYLVGYTGNVAAGNITANYVYATNYVSTGAVYSPVIGNTGAYITGANVNIAGNVNATYFVGNGRFLTGIITGSGSNYGNSNVAAYLPTYFGNIGNVTLGASSIRFPFGTQFFEVNNLDSEILVPYQFTINTGGGSTQFTFDNAGHFTAPAGIVYPDSTIQVTAFSNAAIQTYFGNLTSLALGSGTGSGSQTVSLGYDAGSTGQGSDAVAIGVSAGQSNQSTLAIAIGPNAGSTSQGNGGVAIGYNAGSGSQAEGGVAVGNQAGQNSQGTEAVAMGITAGQTNQGNWTVAIGSGAGQTGQGARGVAIGNQTGQNYQSSGAIAIGAYAGENYQGTNSIAIGTQAGATNQASNSIVLNASGNELDGANSGLYINPVRNDLANVANVVYYNAVTNELTYAPAPSGGGGSSNYSNANVASYLTTYSGNIANIRLGSSGNITFPDGTSQTTAYANVVYNANLTNDALNQNYYLMLANAASGITSFGANTQISYNPSTNTLTVQKGVFGTSVTTTGILAASVGVTVFNTTATIINMGGAANLVNVGSSTTTVTVGSGLGNIVAGNINATQYGNSYGTTATYTGNVTAGNLITTTALYVANITTTGVSGNISGANFITANAIITNGGWGNISNVNLITTNAAVILGANTVTGINGLTVGVTSPTTYPNLAAIFTTTANGYSQLNQQNLNLGSNATTDYIATAGNGNDTTYYVDLGIAGNTYNNTSPNNSLGTALYPNDAYLYAQGNTSANPGGNLVIGTATAGKVVSFIAGGVNSANVVATIASTGLTVNGNITASGIVATQYGNSYGTTASYTGNITAGGSSGPQTRFLWDTWQANSTSALSAFTPSGTIGGNAAFDSSQAYGLKLTTNTTSQSGYINWNSSTVNYTYDMTITASIGASGGTGADGQWIYFGANAAVSGNPNNTNTFGGISVMNHFYSGANQFEVYVNGTQTNIPYILEGSSSYNPSGITVWNASYTSFYNMTLKIRKIQNGARMMEVYLNEAYQGAVNISSWTPAGNYYGVAAYTGGSTAQMWVRQLRIDW